MTAIDLDPGLEADLTAYRAARERRRVAGLRLDVDTSRDAEVEHRIALELEAVAAMDVAAAVSSRVEG